MSAVIFALLLVATALGLERYSTAHSLDDVQGRLEVEDHLVEAGEPAVIHLVVRNSGPRWKMFLAAKLHLNKEFLPCAEHHITQDQTGWGHTVRFTTWLRPGQEADFSTALRLERRGRYVLEPMQVIGGDFWVLWNSPAPSGASTSSLFHPGSALCRNWKRCWAVFWASFR